MFEAAGERVTQRLAHEPAGSGIAPIDEPVSPVARSTGEVVPVNDVSAGHLAAAVCRIRGQTPVGRGGDTAFARVK